MAKAALLSATIAGGVAAAYVLYVEARVATAIADVAERAHLVVRYGSATVRMPGTIGLDELTVSNAEGTFSMVVDSLVLKTSPWPAPAQSRSVSINIPEQYARMQLGTLRWNAKLRGSAVVQSDSGSPVLREASLRFANGRISSSRLAAPGLSGGLDFSSPATGSAVVPSGRLVVRGPSTSTVLAVLGGRSIADSLYPMELGAFELQADMMMTLEGPRVVRIRGESGDARVRGAISFPDQGSNGALLLTTRDRALGLRIEDGTWFREPAPPLNWLEQQLAAAR